MEQRDWALRIMYVPPTSPLNSHPSADIVDRSKAFPAGIIGSLSSSNTLTPLRFPNNQPIRDLHTLIENWEEAKDLLKPSTPVETLDEVEILAPLRGRDVLCVGYNYKKHREEFQKTGFDESVKDDYPDKPG